MRLTVVADVPALAAGLNAAGAQLFLAAAAEADGDVVLSPLSIGVAFGMADVGATGIASDGLAELFDYPVEGEARWSAFNTLLQQVDDVDGPVLTLANRQFPDEDFTLDQPSTRPSPAGSVPPPSRSRSNRTPTDPATSSTPTSPTAPRT